MTDITEREMRVLRIAKVLAALARDGEALPASVPEALRASAGADADWTKHWAEAARFVAVEKRLERAMEIDDGLRVSELNAENDG